MMFLVLILYIFVASTFITGALAVQAAQPLFLNGIRMLLAGGLMLGYCWWRGWIHFNRRHFIAFIGMALFHIALPFGLEFWALQFVTPAKTALIWNLTPFITAIFAYCIWREHITRLKLTGLLIGFFGFIPVMFEQVPQEEAMRSLFHISSGELALLIAVCSASYAWILFKQLMDRGYEPIYINAIAMAGGGIMSLIASWYLEPWHPSPVMDWSTTIWTVIVLIITGNIIVYNLYGYLLKRLSPTFLSFAGFITPFFTVCMQLVLIGGTITSGFVISLIAVTFGLYLFYREELKEITS